MSKTVYVRDPFREFDALVSRAFGPQATAVQRSGWTPATESYREGDDLVLRLELPGVDLADVSVEVVDGKLVISGERRDRRTEETSGRRLSEFRYGSFKRAFRLGGQVGADQVSASYDAGVLSVRVGGAYAKPAGQKIEIATTAPVAEVEAPVTEESGEQA